MFSRLRAKSPKFFVIWQWISGIVAAVTGLPGFLREFGITLPAALSVGENKIVAIASVAALIMARFPTESMIVNKDASGAPLVKNDPKVLPFTTADQTKKAKL